MCVAEAMMPRIILRLIQHLRENSRSASTDAYKAAIQDAEMYITMLLEFNNMGGLMRRVMTSALTNPQVQTLIKLYKIDKVSWFIKVSFENTMQTSSVAL